MSHVMHFLTPRQTVILVSVRVTAGVSTLVPRELRLHTCQHLIVNHVLSYVNNYKSTFMPKSADGLTSLRCFGIGLRPNWLMNV